ncbi:MAG: hypothetical protein M3Q98_17170 [Actinomycetota bacterium]|nr:hypothetical protein [Actinomycetota bacterium]
MNARAKTTTVDRAYAAARLNIADTFLRQAEVSAELVEGAYAHNAVVSAATHAGIAAADGACGHALGVVNSSPNHGDAVRLLRTVSGSAEAAKALAGLLAKKTSAQYTTQTFNASTATTALRQAHVLADFARKVLRT